MPYSSYSSHSGPTPGKIGAIALIVVILFGVLIWALNSFDNTTPAHIGLVRNGGPFDNTQLQREANGDPVILQPASSLTNIGFASTLRLYPATPRFWTIDGDGGDTNQAVTVPTRDTVPVGVSGQFIFSLNQDPKVLADFDEKYGSRTYPGPNGPVSPSDGTDEGFNAFLAAHVPTAVFNALRQEIGNTNCRDLLPSCALVQNNVQAGGPTGAGNGQTAIATVQTRVNEQFARDVNAQLGGPFLTNVSFTFSGVTLPHEVQQAIDRTLAAFAGASESQANLQRAQADAATNAARQQGYTNCAACQQIDIIREQGNAWHNLPPGTVWAPGGDGGLGITLPAPAR